MGDANEILTEQSELQKTSDGLTPAVTQTIDGSVKASLAKDTKDKLNLEEDVANSDPESHDFRKRISATIFSCAAFFGTGLSFGVWGPSLLDLRELLNTSYDKITLIFTTRSAGGLIVMLALAHLFDICCPYFLYMAALIVTITMTIYAPFSPNLPVLLAITVLYGASLAMVLNGGSTTMIRIWKQKAGPVLQAIYLFFICGTMLSPQIARPFLSQYPDKGYNNITYQNYSQSNLTQISVSYHSNEINNETSGFVVQSVLNAVKEAVSQTKIHIAFIIVACYEFLLLVFAFILWAMDNFKLRIKSTNIVATTQENDSDKCFKYTLVLIFAFFNFLVVGADLNFGALIMTFSVKHLNWSKTQGTIITTIYYGAQVLGRAAAIPITKFVAPRYYVSVNLLLSLVSVVLSAIFVNSHYTVIWITCVVYGFTVTGLYPAMLQWLNTLVVVNGTINGLVMAGIPLGFMVFPALSGWLFKTVNPMWFLYTQVIGLIGCFLLFILILLFLKSKKIDVNKRQNIEIELEEGNDLMSKGKVDI